MVAWLSIQTSTLSGFRSGMDWSDRYESRGPQLTRVNDMTLAVQIVDIGEYHGK